MNNSLNSIVLNIMATLMLLPCFPQLTYGSDDTKIEKIVELMKISGIYNMIESSYQENKRHTESVRKMNKRDLMKRFTIIPKNYWEIERNAYDEMLKELEPFDYSTDVYITKWAEFYGQDLTENEVDEILKYYNTTIGKKDLAAQVRAAGKWNKFMAKGYERVLEKATKEYNAKLNSFLQTCVETVQDRQRQ